MMRLGMLILVFAGGGIASAEDIRPFTGKYPPELPDSQEHAYKKVGDVELKLWLYRPKTRDLKPRSAIVFFFGGGWRAGSPQQFENQCRYLAARGMIAATADYRVKNRQGVSPFECVADAKSAIRWLRQNSKRLGIDPERIVASGGSAGGHIACCTGVIPGLDEPGEDLSVSSVPNAMALFNPAVMMRNFGKYKLLDDEKNSDISERTLGRPGEISPIEFVRENLPPTIIFHGTADEAVPFSTVKLFTELMTAKGNRCELKAYEGQPHGFFNPRLRNPDRKEAELKNYRSTVAQLDAFLVSLGYLQKPDKPVSSNIHFRGSLNNCRLKFLKEKKGHVAFLGGSITEMNGYRPMVMEFLQKTFPETEFKFTNAGIASTCSTTGAFRLQRDVLSQGDVDLLFAEFAVNDDQDAAHTRTEAIRGMEGIVRHLLTENPLADIVVTYFVNPGMLEQLQAGKTPLPIAAHKQVAEYYSISTIDLAREVAERIDRGELTWKTYGGTHPAPAGNRICADMIEQLLTQAWRESPDNASPTPHVCPQRPIDPLSYFQAEFVPLKSAKIDSGWEIAVPDWKSLPGSKRNRFTSIPMLTAGTPGAAFTMSFTGTTAIAYVSAGPDAGTLDVSVDGGTPHAIDLYHHFSRGLHYPRSVVLATDLAPGEHRIRVTLAREHNADSRGTAARIMELGVN